MNNLEEIYDQALEMLKQGHSQEQVLVKFAELKNELAPLLLITVPLLTIPKNIVPTPLMKRKYAASPSKTLWLAWVKISKFASVSVGLLLLVSVFAGTVYAASKSVPGETLFGIKKAEEQLRLSFAGSQGEKASLQVAIAQSRLNEAQAIFSDPTSDTEQKTAALNELSSQTASAVAQVSTVAKSNISSAQNPPLLNSLASITKAQATLLAQIKPDAQIQTAAANAQATVSQNSAQLSQINETIAVADNDQALATLNANPNSVAVLGRITKIGNGQITVEKTTFSLIAQTVIQNSESQPLNVSNLVLNQKVSVIGMSSNNVPLPIAEQILVTKDQSSTSTNDTGSVQGVSTTTPASSASSTGASTTPIPITTPDNSASSTPTSTPNSTATGSFILESPNPQYAN